MPEKQEHMSFCFSLQACHEFYLAWSCNHSVVTKESSLIEIDTAPNCTAIGCTINEKSKDLMQSGPPSCGDADSMPHFFLHAISNSGMWSKRSGATQQTRLVPYHKIYCFVEQTILSG